MCRETESSNADFFALRISCLDRKKKNSSLLLLLLVAAVIGTVKLLQKKPKQKTISLLFACQRAPELAAAAATPSLFLFFFCLLDPLLCCVSPQIRQAERAGGARVPAAEQRAERGLCHAGVQLLLLLEAAATVHQPRRAALIAATRRSPSFSRSKCNRHCALECKTPPNFPPKHLSPVSVL